MLYIGCSYSDTEFDDSSSTCSSSSDSDGGEFRPPPGALRTMKHSGGRVTGCNQKQQDVSQNTTTMRLRSSPRKIMPVPTSVMAAHLRKSPRKINATINHQIANTASSGLLSPQFSPRQSPRKRIGVSHPEMAMKIEMKESSDDDEKQNRPKRGSPMKISPTSEDLATRRKRTDFIRQNAISIKSQGRGRKKKEAKMNEEEQIEPKKRGRGRPRSSLLVQPVKKEILSSSEEEEDQEDEDEDEDIDDDDLFAMVSNSTDDDEEDEESSEDDEKKEEETPRLIKNHSVIDSLRSKVEMLEQEELKQPKKRGRKPATAMKMANASTTLIMANDNVRTINGRKRISPTSTTYKPTMKLLMPGTNDFSNPYDDAVESTMANGEDMIGQNQIIEFQYQQKMRDLIDLDRYLGHPDRQGFCRRPVHRPFLLRNLFYMRKQKPQLINAENLFGFCHSRNKMPISMGIELQNSRHLANGGAGSRTDSRASNKMPATIKFTLIRNNNCFGNKSAIVQCFHVTEINERLGQMKRIPSATFEKPVNQKINTYIDIDMLEECQPAALESQYPKAEHFIVRVVFRLEDAEIGGRHLRKVPSRQSDSSNSNKCLRKNGPTETTEVVMFGSARIFSHSLEQGLKAVAGETHILLHTAAELHVDDLNTKSSAGQLARLLNIDANSKKATSDVPFIRIVVLNEDDEEDEEDDDIKKGEQQTKSIATEEVDEKMAMKRMMENLEELEAATSSSATTTVSTRKALNSREDQQQKGLFDQLPKEIAIKFLLRPPNSRLFTLPYQLNAATKTYGNNSMLPDGQQEAKRAKLHISDSSADEPMLDSEEDEEWKARYANPAIYDGNENQQPKRQQIYALRIISPLQCFLCKAHLKLDNLWTLYKHLRFVHPRFEFTYEPSILGCQKTTYHGFTCSLNPQFDASFELCPVSSQKPSKHDRQKHRTVRRQPCTSFPLPRKRQFGQLVQKSSQPIWLVTKPLAKKMRVNDRFPIERFTAMGHVGNWGECEYLQTMGRFAFETPTRIDQRWLIQAGSRKLEDITDLHPAERLMMQMWNAFLPRIRITMIGHKLAYQAVRVFVRHHWHQIEQFKLRTHFLLHLTTLLNANAIDEDERYDLMMRAEQPEYRPQADNAHWVTRELSLLENEKMSQKELAGGNQQQKEHQKGEPQKQQKSRQRTCAMPQIMKATADIRNSNGNTHRKMPSTPTKQQQPKHYKKEILPIQELNFVDLTELRARYPFTTNKRIERIWKFIRQYDFADFTMISSPSTSSNNAQPPSISWPSSMGLNVFHPNQTFTNTTIPASSTSSASTSSSASSTNCSGSSGFFSGSNLSKESSTSQST